MRNSAVTYLLVCATCLLFLTWGQAAEVEIRIAKGSRYELCQAVLANFKAGAIDPTRCGFRIDKNINKLRPLNWQKVETGRYRDLNMQYIDWNVERYGLPHYKRFHERYVNALTAGDVIAYEAKARFLSKSDPVTIVMFELNDDLCGEQFYWKYDVVVTDGKNKLNKRATRAISGEIPFYFDGKLFLFHPGRASIGFFITEPIAQFEDGHIPTQTVCSFKPSR